MPVIGAVSTLYQYGFAVPQYGFAVLRDSLGAGRARFPQYMSEGRGIPRGANVWQQSVLGFLGAETAPFPATLCY